MRATDLGEAKRPDKEESEREKKGRREWQAISSPN
jgi:hypothetical protein